MMPVIAKDTLELRTPWGEPPKTSEFSPPLKANQIYRIPANPEAGFYFPYFFIVPTEFIHGRPILINPNNDGLTGISKAQREYFASILNEEMAYVFGNKLGVVTLSPSFPRPKLDSKSGNLYTHALTRETLLTEEQALKRIDQQLLAMHSDLRKRLSSVGLHTDNTVLLYGFSAAADFVTRLAAIYPDKVRAVAAGGLGGLPILPVTHLDGRLLTYPVGVGDFESIVGKPFKSKQFATIPMLFMQGSIDENDSVPEGDEMLNPNTFESDSYSFEQAKWINQYFGTLPIDRLPIVKAVYHKASPSDFAYISIHNELHTDKKLKPVAVAFFDCVLSGDSPCAEKTRKNESMRHISFE